MSQEQEKSQKVTLSLSGDTPDRRIGTPKGSVGHARDGAQISRLRAGCGGSPAPVLESSGAG